MSVPSAYGNTTAAPYGNALTREGKAERSAGTAASVASSMFLPTTVRSVVTRAQRVLGLIFNIRQGNYRLKIKMDCRPIAGGEIAMRRKERT